MAASRKFVCITCPRGCALEVEVDTDGTFVSVSGNACKRGVDYARSEVTDPRRSLTTTVRIKGADVRRLPVRSAGTIPLGRLKEASRALDGVLVEAPVTCGSVVARDLLGLGVDIIATDSMERSRA